MNTYGEALSEKAWYFLQVSGTYQYGNYAIWVTEGQPLVLWPFSPLYRYINSLKL